MNPPPARCTERRDGQKVTNPKRAGSPETDHADPFASQDPVTLPGWDVSS
jgi:hypothetical protein